MSKKSFRRGRPGAPRYPTLDDRSPNVRLGLGVAAALVVTGTAACGAAPVPDLGDPPYYETDGGESLSGGPPLPDAGYEQDGGNGEPDGGGQADGGEH